MRSDSTRRIAYAALRWTGLALLWRRTVTRGCATIVAYHDVDPDSLDRHLQALAGRYRFIALRELVDAVGSGRSMRGNPLVVTLDDGWTGNRELLDVFARHAVTPTIFLTSGIVGTSRPFWWTLVDDPARLAWLKSLSNDERLKQCPLPADPVSGAGDTRPMALSREDIDAMRERVDFQAHTMTHPILSRCTDDEAWVEIAGSRAQLEEEFGLDIYAFAYPNGHPADLTDRDVAYVREAGYSCAVVADPGSIAAGADLYRLPRLTVEPSTPVTELVVRCSGIVEGIKTLVGRGGTGTAGS